MSLAWKGSVVLAREPARVGVIRVARRAAFAAAWLLVVWFIDGTVLRVAFGIFGVVAALGAVLAVANLLRNKRAVLVHSASGVFEWPRSLQETWLRLPHPTVAGREVTVAQVEGTALSRAAEPRVTLTAGDQSLPQVPLYGEEIEHFVERANGLLAGRDTVLRARDSRRPEAGGRNPAAEFDAE